ncbi:hypothetical protein Tco_0619985 [Tanacetum coccineum]
MIQNEFITLPLAQFGQILIIPFNGQAVFTNEWDLSSLAFFQETEGPYHTDLPTPKEIHQFLQFQRVEFNRTIKSKTITLSPNQVLTKELRQDLKRWEELIRENVFGLGGHRDHLPACLDHILYYDTKTPSPKHQLPSPSAPNAPLKTPSTKDTSSSSIDYILRLPTSTSSSTNGYLNSSTSPPPRVPPPLPIQESGSIDITLTLSPITPLDVQFNTPSPSLPLFGHPIP